MNPAKEKYGFSAFFKEDGMYYFQFNDEAGEPILFSHGYQSEKGRDSGIQAVIRNAADSRHYETEKTRKGQYFFILKSGNHQEVGRSRMFDTRAEMQEKLKLLKAVRNDTPVFDTALPPSEEKAAALTMENPSREEGAKKMPRHKFSIIYYPDSEVWSIIHDLTGDSKQFQACDGQVIEEFLISHVPGAEPGTAQPKKPAAQGAAVKPEKVIREAVELKLLNAEGNQIDSFAKPSQFHEMEVLLKEGKAIPSLAYEAHVIIKSFEDRDTVLIGKAKGQAPKGNRILIPLGNTSYLKPGMYRITAAICQKKEGKEVYNYEGDKLVMLE